MQDSFLAEGAVALRIGRTRSTVRKMTAVWTTPTERSMDTKAAGSPVELSLM